MLGAKKSTHSVNIRDQNSNLAKKIFIPLKKTQLISVSYYRQKSILLG